MTELILTYDEWLEAAKASETYHYPNRDHRTIGPFGSGATLKTDGEKIVGRVEAPAFKVGSVYRDASGRITRIVGDRCNPEPGTAHCETINACGGSSGNYVPDGFRVLATGADPRDFEGDCAPLGRRLLPGELVQRDGQWVAMEEEVGINGLTEAETSATASVAGIVDKPVDINAQMLANDQRQPTARERSVMARINLAKALTAEWEAAKKQPALAHPYPFARNFQG